MAYLAYYRAFRPTTFDEVVRQEHIVRILKNQIRDDKVGHAYLFCGPRGTGKTTLAKIFARAINCEHPVDGSPCGKCPTCLALSQGGSLDIEEIDAASNNGVDEMRDLREKVQYPPVSGRYKVYIIDEVHMLSASAFNAVLKTLEEPPAHAVFILATTEPQKIPETILSRCMRFDFKLIPREDLEKLICSVFDRTGKEYEKEAVTAIARAGAGSARDCLSIADMCSSYSPGKLTYADVNEVLGSADFYEIAEVVRAMLSDDCDRALSGVEGILSTGKSVGVLLRDMLNFLNWCTIVKTCRNAGEIVNLPADRLEKIGEVCSVCDGHKLIRVSDVMAKAEGDMRYALNARITLETAVMKCATPQADYDMEALLGRVAALERKVAEAAAAGAAGAVPAARPSVEDAANPGPSAAGYAEEAPSGGEAWDGDYFLGEDMFTARDDAPGYAGHAPAGGAEPSSEKSAEMTAEMPAEKPAEKPAEMPAARDGLRAEPAAENPFEAPSGTGKASSVSEADRMFARILRTLRETHRAVLFTLCDDLSCSYEGGLFVMATADEATYRGLCKETNRASLGEVLSGLGIADFEIRYSAERAGAPVADDTDKAIDALRKNFEGVDVIIK